MDKMLENKTHNSGMVGPKSENNPLNKEQKSVLYGI